MSFTRYKVNDVDYIFIPDVSPDVSQFDQAFEGHLQNVASPTPIVTFTPAVVPVALQSGQFSFEYITFYNSGSSHGTRNKIAIFSWNQISQIWTFIQESTIYNVGDAGAPAMAVSSAVFNNQIQITVPGSGEIDPNYDTYVTGRFTPIT